MSSLEPASKNRNNTLKALHMIGDKPHVRMPNMSATNPIASLPRPRAYVGAQDDLGSASSRGSARPRAFVRGDDDTSSMGSHTSARPKAFVRKDDDAGSMGSHTPVYPRMCMNDNDTGSVSSRSSARPKAFVRTDDDAGSVSSRSSARPKAFVRNDNDVDSVSSRSSARPKTFARTDDDANSVSSRVSARPKAFIRRDEDSSSMSSNQGLSRSRLDSSQSSMGSNSSRPHVGIAGGGGLTAAMLQQHRVAAGIGGLDLGVHRARYDIDETRSMTGVFSRMRRPPGANGHVPHVQSLSSSMGPRIRVPDADIPSDIPNHIVDEIKMSLQTRFESRNGVVDKKVADLRTDVANLTTQMSSISAQISELRDAVLMSGNINASADTSVASNPDVCVTVQANADAIASLEEHNADLLSHQASVDRDLVDLGTRVKSLSSETRKISTLENNIEALVAHRQKQEQGLFKLADKVQIMHHQMCSLADMNAAENLLSDRLTREFREMEDRLSQNANLMAEKMEHKLENLEKQICLQRQEDLAALKNDLLDDIERLQQLTLPKSDLHLLQNAQSQCKNEVAQLLSAVDCHERNLQDAKMSSARLRDDLADVRTELKKKLQNKQRSAATVMEEKLEQIASNSKEKSNIIDDHISKLAKKHKKIEEVTTTLQEVTKQVKVETSHRTGSAFAGREKKNDKLRQHLARFVADLEALGSIKAELKHRFASEEQQFHARLKELRATFINTEKRKESQRLELMQKLQKRSQTMGAAKASILENLLQYRKAENEEKDEFAHKSEMEVTEACDQLHNEKETKMRQLTSELQGKETEAVLLTKTLKRVELVSATMLDQYKREALTARRVEVTKEHALFIAQLKLKEMVSVAHGTHDYNKITQFTIADIEERNELEKMFFYSHLKKDELKQELKAMIEELNAAKEHQKVIMEDTITKLSSNYEDKIGELQQQIVDKGQAMRQLCDAFAEKGDLNVLEDELTALKDGLNDSLGQIQRVQIEHELVTLESETSICLEGAIKFPAMKLKLEDRILELEGTKSELESIKTTIADLVQELKNQEAVHEREVSILTHAIKDARSKIDECTAQILDLDKTKACLARKALQMEAKITDASAEKDKKLATTIKMQIQSEVNELRAELAEVSSKLAEKQTMLTEAKQSDEVNRERLVEMAMTGEETQRCYVSQIESLTLKLHETCDDSQIREQDLEDIIARLNANVVETLAADSSKKMDDLPTEGMEQVMKLTTMTLQASQHREQQLRLRIERALEELVQIPNAVDKNKVVEYAEVCDEPAITHQFDVLHPTHRQTVHELKCLQAEYELTTNQAAAGSHTAQGLGNQIMEHEIQIGELESVMEQLCKKLKEHYHKSAVIAQGSGELNAEMDFLQKEEQQLKRQLEAEEKDCAEREMSYQRHTATYEREAEKLCIENATLSAAIAAVREKMCAMESAKYNDIGELHNIIKGFEERAAALQPTKDKIVSLDMDFTATRQEVVSLTAEVQYLYQQLTACCDIVEWSKLRASLLDEEEKLTQARLKYVRELAKVQSVEQEMLMNAEFLNGLLVARGLAGDDNLLNDHRWMQKYALITPEALEKLCNVKSRLRDAMLNLYSSWNLPCDESSEAPISQTSGKESSDEGDLRHPPTSQSSSVDGVTLALTKAKQDYFSKTSETEQEKDVDDDGGRETDQPDVEQ